MELCSRNKQLAKAYQKVATQEKPDNRITTVFLAVAFQVKNKIEDHKNSRSRSGKECSTAS